MKSKNIDDIVRRCWVAAKNRESVRRASEMAREMHPKSSEMHIGNAAAMRDALNRLLNLAYEVQDANSECEYGPKTSVPAQFVIDVAKSALSAPPRNCDVYDSESCRMAYHLHGDGHITMQAFADWLFAPAKEGGAK